ncbi:hypothetical protein DERP_000341 [Dermatophagoides pteronyssinus]|uniref:Uncharacterized protein n=1 Tax=Dermatophagoides pteronyssinus TaxID=6956 RepID=A0ABQ8J006_DERPT|nr:hypothetical protein DERP_000341 [Dermatophagoides pteronyssinus]
MMSKFCKQSLLLIYFDLHFKLKNLNKTIDSCIQYRNGSPTLESLNYDHNQFYRNNYHKKGEILEINK